MGGPLLEVNDLEVRFKSSRGEVIAVSSVSFEVNVGETVGLVGESGSGKSMTSLAIMGLIPDQGKLIDSSIKFEGAELTALSEKDLRKLRGSQIGMVFQDPSTSLNPVFTIGNQLIETVRLHRKCSSKEAKAVSAELLSEVGIPSPEERMRDYAHNLSGGMRQRVMIALALAGEPKLIIADEPTTALDVTVQAQILDLLVKVCERHGSSLLLISHDLGVIAQMTRRVAVMYAGQVMEYGLTEQIFTGSENPYTRSLLRSVIRPDHPKEDVSSIKGTPPSGTVSIEGCPFQPRCDWAKEICASKPPPLVEVSKGHESLCHFAGDLK